MKKLLIVLTLVLGISAFTTNASASYTIDDAQIENLFATATATTFSMVADVGYILTCGGIFGLMPLIDLIVLAVNWDDISAYVDNPKFFMW
jgi:hypothetical protein